MPPKCHPHDSGALASLDISNNQLTKGGYINWSERAGKQVDGDGHEVIFTGVIALAEAIKK